MIRVADYVMSKIVSEGVGHLFYVPGGQCVYLMDALRRNDDLEGIAMHHEQAASMAALSYSLYNGNMGACLVTTGCAGTNTMTGLLHAWQDSIPCVFVSGQQNYGQTVVASNLPLRQVGVQEADITTLVKPVTKYAVTVEKPEDIVYHMEKALYCAKEGRKGPVWVDIPLDVQNAMIDEEKQNHFQIPAVEKREPASDDTAYVAECLKNAKRPIILAGAGVRSAGAIRKMREFAKKQGIPVAFTRFSYDMMAYDEVLNMGVVSGVAGASRYGNFAVQNADLVLAIGTRLSIDTTGGDRAAFAREAKILVVDIDECEHKKEGVSIDRLILADAGAFLDCLQKEEIETDTEEWVNKCVHWKKLFGTYEEGTETKNPIDMKYAITRISECMPSCSVVVSDAGLTGAAVPAATHIKPEGRIIHSFAQGEMGYSLPGACGVAAIADGPVISYTGDGSFMMNLQELQTLVRNQFNLKIVIMNNNGYSGVRHGQKAHFRGKSIGTDPSNGVDFPDYGKVAQAFGIPYYKVSEIGDLQQGIDAMLQDNTPFVLEIMTDPEQFDLHNALVMYGKRKFGFRPIEDQSPFIDRDTFFAEMIVEPMETSYGKPV